MKRFGALLTAVALLAAGSAQPAVAAEADQVVVSGFRVRSTQAPVGGDVRVTGLYRSSVGAAITCTTDFGDGHVSTGACDVRHPYAQTGEYTITQTATSADGGVAPRQQGQIRVVPDVGPLSVDAVVTGSGGLRGNLATYTTSGYDVRFTWVEWGDGGATQAPGVIGLWADGHTYPAAGTYTVKVRVTDSAGAIAETTTTATIRA